MKTYEETRRTIREAIKNYTDNTHAVATMMMDIVTNDLNCSQFDKFFEKLIERVFHYFNRKIYEDIIINESRHTDRPLTASPNSDDVKTIYHKNLDTIGTAVADATDYVYDRKDYTEKDEALLVSDLADAIYSGISPMLAINLAKELLALNDDSLDSDDISEIIATMDYNHTYCNTMSVAIRDYIANTSEADMKDNLGYIVHIVSCWANIEKFSLFYALVQKELMERLDKEGENTDVF